MTLIGNLNIPSYIIYAVAKPRFQLQAADLPMLLNVCCSVLGQAVVNVKSETRRREVVTVRKLYCYIAREHKAEMLSLQEIGNLLGYDHSNVLFHHRTTAGHLEYDKYLSQKVEEIKKLMGLI